MTELLTVHGEGRLARMENDLLRVCLSNFGAAIFSIQLKLPDGTLEDLVLPCESPEAFLENPYYYGATVGRVANRIKDGRAVIDGVPYQLTKNDGNNSAHGGEYSFARRFWDMEVLEERVVFRLLSRDGEAGYPGNLQVEAEYRFDEEGALLITHRGVSDRDTIMSLTNHAYWCLGGPDEKIYDHELMVNGRFFLETDEELIPTGQILSVKGTPFDFTAPRPIKDGIFDDCPAVKRNRGYDVSFVRDGRGMGLAARLTAPSKGRVLEVYTTLPDIHVYTANFLQDAPGKDGRRYTPHSAVCLEAGRLTDAVNHPHFGDIFLRAGERYCQRIRFRIRRL